SSSTSNSLVSSLITPAIASWGGFDTGGGPVFASSGGTGPGRGSRSMARPLAGGGRTQASHRVPVPGAHPRTRPRRALPAVLPRGRELAAERRQAPLEQRFDRRLGLVHDAGDLRNRQVGQDPEAEHGPLIRGQAVQRLQDPLRLETGQREALDVPRA